MFKPLRTLGESIDFDEYDMPASALLEELRAVGLPKHYRFELTLDDSAIDMEYYTRGLIGVGASPAETVDYYIYVNIVHKNKQALDWIADQLGALAASVTEWSGESVEYYGGEPVGQLWEFRTRSLPALDKYYT